MITDSKIFIPSLMSCHRTPTIRLGFLFGVIMLQNIFKQYLKKERGANRSNIKRSNDALLLRIAKCFDTFNRYNVGVDYYTPIFGNNFGLDNKARINTLNILKQEKIIEVKTNKDGKESFQSCWKYNPETKKKEFDPTIVATPKSYCFTEYGWKLIQNKQLQNEIKWLTDPIKEITKYQSVEQITSDILKKAAEDNLSLKFKLTKPIDLVAAEYLDKNKSEWHVTNKNYKYKFKEARQVVLNTINNFNNKLLKFKERMYTALSLCPKDLRQYIITPDGGSIDQAFDINSSIYTLLGSTLEYYMNEKHIPIPAGFYEEKNKLQDLCFAEEHIYEYIGKWNDGHWTKKQIKPHNMEVVFSNNEDIQKMDSKKTARNQIKQFLQAEFPVIWSILTHFEQEVNEQYEQQLEQYNKYIKAMEFYNIKKEDWITANKINELKPLKPKHVKKPREIKSTIWRYFEQVETDKMLKLKAQTESNMNTIAYWIHDCLCLDQSLINNSTINQINQWFYQLIKSPSTIQSINRESINQSMMLSIAFNNNQNDSLSPLGGVEVEMTDDEEDTQLVDDERVIEQDEYEILIEEIDNKTQKGKVKDEKK